MPIIGVPQSTFDYFSALIQQGYFDKTTGRKPNKQSGIMRLIAETDPFILSGELTETERTQLQKKWAIRQKQLATKGY